MFFVTIFLSIGHKTKVATFPPESFPNAITKSIIYKKNSCYTEK